MCLKINDSIVKIFQTFFLCKIYTVFFEIVLMGSYTLTEFISVILLIENTFNYKKTILEKTFEFWEEKKSCKFKLEKYESWRAIEINLVKLIKKIFIKLLNVAILIIICIIKFHCKLFILLQSN